MIHKRVKFNGNTYWLHSNAANPNILNISPLDHYSDGGELLADPFSDISWAIVEDKKVMRFGCEIGLQSDLEYIDEQTAS